MYDRILVPTDGSPLTTRVVEYALDLAVLSGGELYTCFVVDDADIPARNVEQVLSSLEDEAEAATERVAGLAAERDVAVTTAVLRGAPHAEILAYADKIDADLIVMGTHGRRGFDRYLLGSVTERVIRTGNTPVLTVKLMRPNKAVTTGDEAIEVARDALEREGIALTTVPETPYQESSTWIVRAESDGDTFNVHIDATSGNARVAKIR
ncbi:universal stress protein [Haladaptatus sp. CMSO5]|uniref:universal stress protein n=1 Tax=Haladaptatus sp. CMSO5 TaxID=3120514 RepID=UPI002FCE0295